MRTSKFWSIVAVSAAMSALPLIANAQTASAPSAPARAVAPPPPETMRLEEGAAPDITIKQPDTKKRITEKKVHGKVTEVKVQTGKTTYYAHPNDPAGSAMPGDAQSQASRPVQFRIGEFGPPDAAKKQREPVETLAPAPVK
tara:strand:- start:62945 stop:63370 length:426 start_codon:yes stop_codon:yes gene_type:complete